MSNLTRLLALLFQMHQNGHQWTRKKESCYHQICFMSKPNNSQLFAVDLPLIVFPMVERQNGGCDTLRDRGTFFVQNLL